MGSRFGGHLWTIGPTLRGRLKPPVAPDSVRWTTHVDDPDLGLLPIRGAFRKRDSDTLVLLLHGLGGNLDSFYLRQAAIDVEEAGFACLRISMRGAEGCGSDLYHGGLTEDIRAVLSSAEVLNFERVLIIGYSLGGHQALKAAAEGLPAGVAGVVAVGSPLDLQAGTQFLDGDSESFYRKYILSSLIANYKVVADKGRGTTPYSRVAGVEKLREFDALTVVPRFGFRDVDDYYKQASVADTLGQIKVPSLLIASDHDPMIPRRVVEPVISGSMGEFSVRFVNDGGHVYFPPKLDLGYGGRLGIAGQALAWLETNAQ